MKVLIDHLLSSLSPTDPIDEENARLRVAVSMVASAAIVLLVLPAMFSQLVQGWWEEFWVLVATLLCLAAVLWFNHMGRLRWASRLLAITALVSSVLMVHLSGIGIRDTSMLIFPAILVIGALILDAAFFLAFAVSVVSLLGLEVVLQILRLNHHSYGVQATYSDLVYALSILSVTAFCGGLLAATLRHAISTYHSLVGQLGEGVLLLDTDQVIRVANPSAERIFNVPAGRLVGRNLLQFIVEGDRGAIAALETQSRQCRVLFRAQCDVRR